jgi:hypothetical protein
VTGAHFGPARLRDELPVALAALEEDDGLGRLAERDEPVARPVGLLDAAGGAVEQQQGAGVVGSGGSGSQPRWLRQTTRTQPSRRPTTLTLA